MTPNVTEEMVEAALVAMYPRWAHRFVRRSIRETLQAAFRAIQTTERTQEAAIRAGLVAENKQLAEQCRWYCERVDRQVQKYREAAQILSAALHQDSDARLEWSALLKKADDLMAEAEK